ncbi:phosphatase PAP2 family protein [Rickettsiales bacterium LUAb2]
MLEAKQLYKTGTLLFVLLMILSIISIFFVDARLAIFIHKIKLDQLLFLRFITEGFPIYLPIIYIILLFCLRKKIVFGNLLILIVFVIGLTYLSEVVHDILKIIFGRYWPSTWKNNNLSLLHDNVFGFNWFHGWNSSYPSGHTLFVVVTTFCMWIIYKPLKYLWLAIMLVMVVSLVALNYHFLGDCFAGAALGVLFATYGMGLYISSCSSNRS